MGLLISTKQSSITSPGVEIAGFEGLFSGPYSVLEQYAYN